MGIAPLGHRQGLLMAIADLAAYNSQTHGDSSPQHSRLTPARTRGRPQTAPSARGSSPARPRSDGSVSPERGLKVLLFLFSILPTGLKPQNRPKHSVARATVRLLVVHACLMSVQASCRHSHLFFLHGLLPPCELHSWCMLSCSGWSQHAAACTARLPSMLHLC